jgi:hypothetical protein
MEPSFRLDISDKQNALQPPGKKFQFLGRPSHALVTIQWDIATRFICFSNDFQVKERLLPSAAFTGRYANVDCQAETPLLNFYLMKIVL